MHLLDINVWLGLISDNHVHHSTAKTWFENVADNRRCFFCRFTQQGVLRLSTNATVFPDSAFTLREAWAAYDAFLADPRVGFLSEPQGTESLWRQLTQHNLKATKLWADAYLAAFALAGNLELITFDKGFTQYPALRYSVLS
jgi:uncharacterized protein